MTAPTHRRGVTLVLVMLLLLIFLGLTVNLLSEARSQGMLHAGIKLNQMYVMAAKSPLNEIRAELPDLYISPDPSLYTDKSPGEFRFGTMMKDGNPLGPSPSIDPELGILIAEGDIDMNAGLLELTYRVYAKNNPDDPAFALNGFDIAPGETIDETWDFDGRIILSSAVFNRGETTNPLAIQSEMVSPAGVEIVERHNDAQQETGSTTENTGYREGSAPLTLDSLY